MSGWVDVRGPGSAGGRPGRAAALDGRYSPRAGAHRPQPPTPVRAAQRRKEAVFIRGCTVYPPWVSVKERCRLSYGVERVRQLAPPSAEMSTVPPWTAA
jgi:hypothetical protein